MKDKRMASREDYFNCSEKWQMDCKAIKQLNIKTKNWREFLTDETIIREDLITIQVNSRFGIILMHLMARWVLVDFDHVKNSLKLDDEELMKMSSNQTYNINVSGDIKQMLNELGIEKGKEIALHRGGGNKAQKSTNIHVTVFFTIVSLQEEENEQVKAKDEKNVGDEENFSFNPFDFRLIETLSFLFFFLLENNHIFSFATFQDKIGSWYSNVGKGASESGSVGGGVGKYLKVRNVQAESAAADWYAGNCYSKEKEIRCSNRGI
ncbi:Peptidyl-prolyl cis-trans isomerase CYP65 [Camellia lanceoleosa]|uniref:Peptidyl-prolyl cis-trans isomerase CYP65 n=1 Tax=Camellia lanceoleosa TaxID=1840588 RepID=A0ACC0IZF5_9ERIC|nr:Peptidyl-prolyl cis-trans isomerase CYP65 [Camellia lanceoleosa]